MKCRKYFETEEVHNYEDSKTIYIGWKNIALIILQMFTISIIAC